MTDEEYFREISGHLGNIDGHLTATERHMESLDKQFELFCDACAARRRWTDKELSLLQNSQSFFKGALMVIGALLSLLWAAAITLAAKLFNP